MAMVERNGSTVLHNDLKLKKAIKKKGTAKQELQKFIETSVWT